MPAGSMGHVSFTGSSIFLKETYMTKPLSIFLAITVMLPFGLLSQVEVEEIDMDIPTYLVGPEDPHPPLWNWRVYPYPMQTDISRTKTTQTYRVIRLENEYVALLIIPELGGKIMAAFDKTNDNFDYIYHNHVIKPGLVALRGAWTSGGIEWNFPSYGHTVNTFSPVNHRILRHDDGSVTCVVGTEEWVRRMKWLVFVTLYPGCSAFKTRIRLDNRTMNHNNAYFWANAATHAWDDTRVIFPETSYTYAGGRRNPRPWPVYQGRDVSWYRNTPYAYDFFCGTPGDFNGSYNYDKDNGMAHYAYRFDSLGKKFWTWGTARSGQIWEDLLTDSDGQYIEVQAGRLLTQRGDTWIFEPHLVEEWEEWWYPLKNMKGCVSANPDAAVNLVESDKGVFLSLNATREYRGIRIELCGDEKLIWAKTIDISPKGFFNEDVPLETEFEIFQLKVVDDRGKSIIEYSTAPTDVPEPELQPDFSGEESGSAEIAFLKGYYAMKHWAEEEAFEYFKEALKLDSDHTEAMLWLGIFLFRSGKTQEALDLFNGCLQRNEDNHSARYYRALSKIRLGKKERTKEDLYMVGRRASFRHVAPFALAGLEIGEGNLPRARELLESVLSVNPEDVQARIMLSAVARQAGDESRARLLLEEALNIDPLSAPALMELTFLNGDSELDILRGDAQYFLEAASDYMNMNLPDEAINVLQKYLELPLAAQYPLIYYFLGYLYHSTGKKELAEQYFEEGAFLSPEYVFPFRIESEKVLKVALQYNPQDWKASYYLGNLMTSKLRWEEGLSFYLDAAQFHPGFSTLYRNLGEVYWRKLDDLEKAEKMYEKALIYSPGDYRLRVTLDEIYATRGKHPERDLLFQKASPSVKENFNYLLSRARYFVDTQRYEEALAILRNNRFLPWEGWTGARQVFVKALLMRAEDRIDGGQFEEAIRDLEEAMTYPENLGTGKPAFPIFARENYLIGLCFENLGDEKRAMDYFSRAAGEEPGSSPEQARYVSMARRKLKKMN